MKVYTISTKFPNFISLEIHSYTDRLKRGKQKKSLLLLRVIDSWDNERNINENKQIEFIDFGINKFCR